MIAESRRVVLKSWPRGNPRADDLAIETGPVAAPVDGRILVRTHYLSLDPLIRFALDEKRLTGIAQVNPGETMFGGAVSEVVASAHPDHAVGDIVEGRTGWAEHVLVDPAKTPLRRVTATGAPVSTALGVLGMPGQTAHAAMIAIGRVAAGETVVISAAAGAVGTIAGQIGKRIGARMVGIAGGPDKCAALLKIGYDAAVDYKAADFQEQLKAACPGGIDVYIENVGGDVMLKVLPLLKYRARMPVCGFIAYYGMGLEGPGPDRLPGFMRTIMSKGLELRGFGGTMVGGQAALDDLAEWVAEGSVKPVETIVDGLENAPEAFAGIFSGNGNVGKLLVRVAR